MKTINYRFEELARAEAVKIIGAQLYPTTDVEGKYIASFDGITMLGDIVFEHKMLNELIENAIESGEELPIEYRAQIEHQLLVSGAEKCLFMASKWDESGNLIKMLHVWYYPDLELRQKIIEGWDQWIIESGKKPVNEVIATLESVAPLTDDQKMTLARFAPNTTATNEGGLL